jgi:hypothetical protein
MALYRLLLLLAIASSMLNADLTLKVRTTGSAGRTSEATEYYKGNLMRRDFGSGYQVVDFSTGRSFSVAPEKKEYYPFDGSKLATKQVVDTSHKIFIESICSATGEQRRWFGYTAHHYLITKKSHTEINGQPSESRETHSDAWILDSPVPPHVEGIASPNANFVLGGGPAAGIIKVPDLKVTHSGPSPHGLVAFLKTEQYESELIALSLASLEESLFEAPNGFREVKSPVYEAQPLSWGDKLEFAWLSLRAWIDSLFGS